MRGIKSAALSAALLLTLSAGTCEGPAGDIVARVQDATVKACGFLPAATSVIKILDTLVQTGGATTMAALAANGICAIVKPAGKKMMPATRPTFNGVPVEGKFIDQ